MMRLRRTPRRGVEFAALVLLVMCLAACASVRRADFTPGFDLRAARTAHLVVLPQDERGIHRLITEAFTARGLRVSTGSAAAPPGTDVVITYEDRWQWDITMFMSGLQIQLRDPKTNFLLGTGAVSHQSLNRVPPDTIVKEVVDELYLQAGRAR